MAVTEAGIPRIAKESAAMTPLQLDRFLSKIRLHPVGCWEWIGSTCQGYGKIRRGPLLISAHRVAWQHVHGAIPDELVVMHRCDVLSPPDDPLLSRRCVNPMHLQLGTPSANTSDMWNKKRAVVGRRFGEHNGAAQLTDEDVILLRSLYKPRKRGLVKALAERFGMSRDAIGNAARGQTWKHVKCP